MKEEILKKLHKEEIKILNKIVDICEHNDLQYFLIGGTLLGAVRHKGFIPWDDDLDIAMPRTDYNKFIDITKNMKDTNYFLDYNGTNNKYWLPFIKIRMKDTIYQEELQGEYKGDLGIWVDIFPLDNGCENIEKLEAQQKKLKKLNSCLQIRNLRKMSSNKTFIKKILTLLSKIIPNSVLHFIINKKMTFNNKNESEYFVNFGSQYGVKRQTHLKEKYLPTVDIQFEENFYKAPRDYEYVLKKIYGENYMELPPEEKRITHNPIRIKFENEEEINFE